MRRKIIIILIVQVLIALITVFIAKITGELGFWDFMLSYKHFLDDIRQDHPFLYIFLILRRYSDLFWIPIGIVILGFIFFIFLLRFKLLAAMVVLIVAVSFLGTAGISAFSLIVVFLLSGPILYLLL